MKLEVFTPGGGLTYTDVDEADHLWACQYRWRLTRAGYVTRSQRRGKDNKPLHMFLHREILGLKHGYKGQIVDHIDGDPLNNLRDNLRIATHSENAHNRKGQKIGKGTSQYRGVSWFTSKGMWRVAVSVNGTRTLVGYYDDELEAAWAAYDFYAEHVPFANVTAPQPGTSGETSARHTASGPGC